MSSAFGHKTVKTSVSDNVNCCVANIGHAKINKLSHEKDGSYNEISLERLSQLSGDKIEKLYKVASTMNKGDTGGTGATGPIGQRGPPGRMGVHGPVGNTGPVGLQGDTGFGERGPTGPPGHTGCIGPVGFPGPSTIGGAPIIITDLEDGDVLKYLGEEHIWINAKV